jgi:hypothetical protein
LERRKISNLRFPNCPERDGTMRMDPRLGGAVTGQRFTDGCLLAIVFAFAVFLASLVILWWLVYS